MKRLVLLVVLLSGCALFGARETVFTVDSGPGAVFGSSEVITGFSSVPEGVCRFQVTTAGADRAVACKTPATVKLVTAGRVVVRLLPVAP